MVDSKMFSKTHRSVPVRRIQLEDEKKCDISSDEDRFDSEPSLDLTTQLKSSRVVRVSDRKLIKLNAE